MMHTCAHNILLPIIIICTARRIYDNEEEDAMRTQRYKMQTHVLFQIAEALNAGVPYSSLCLSLYIHLCGSGVKTDHGIIIIWSRGLLQLLIRPKPPWWGHYYLTTHPPLSSTITTRTSYDAILATYLLIRGEVGMLLSS